MAKKRKATATPSNPKPEEEKETPKIPKTEQKPDKKEEPKKPDKKEEEPPKKPEKEEEPKKQPEETKQIEPKEEEEEEEEEEESEEEEEESEESSEEEEEEESEETKRENLKKLLEPFSKDQIIEFIKEAALKDPSIVANITNSAQSDPSNRKIFVFGLGWDATSDQLLNAFKPFGEIEECKLVTDKVTRRAKGYAFLQFKTLKSTKRALKEPQKKIGNRVTTCQLASAGGVGSSGGSSGGGSVPEGRRLYVGNVGPQVNPEKIKSFFAKFGEIEEGPIGIDSVTGKFKGYAIFVYKTVEGFKKALEEPFKLFDGVQFQCRPANKNQPPGNAVAAAPQQSSTPGVNYGLNVNPGFNPAALMMAQNQGIGVTNPLMGLAGNGFGPSMGYGLGGMGAGMIGGYNQAALQAMSAYQSAQLGQSSGGATHVSGVGPRAQTGLGSLGNTGLGSHGSTGYGSLGSTGYGSLGSTGYGSLGSTGLGSLGNTYPSFGR